MDLYEGLWDGIQLGPADYVLSADEKTSIQVRIHKHKTLKPLPNSPMKVEHEYQRGGSLNYMAAWDVHRGKIFGNVEPQTGIKPFGRLVDVVMSQEPYRSASRVFWIVGNGSSHHGESAITRLQEAWPNATIVHLPIHASWLNQIEIYFSVIQRKVLTPNDFESLTDVEDRFLRFQDHYEKVARPFEWKFTRGDLANLIKTF
ncbi:MAG TPA: transposase [Desulfosporosinus sp.]|nr:transposase [Desulfosporosinus sp.]